MTLALDPEVLPETPPKPAWEGSDRAGYGKLGGSTERGCMATQRTRDSRGRDVCAAWQRLEQGCRSWKSQHTWLEREVGPVRSRDFLPKVREEL